MDINEHKKKFDEVIRKYGLEEKADEIADYVLKKGNVEVDEFAKLFNIEVEDAKILLSFIEKGINFRSNKLN
ncbi:MAG: hypothetical protein ACQEP1_05085 [Nanobdellota archaeon]